MSTYEYRASLHDLARMENEYLEEQKKDLRRTIGTIVSGIGYRQSQSQHKTEEILRSRMEEAFAIATNTYSLNQDKLPPAQLKQHIIDTLMASVFADGRGYYWILDTNHVMIAHPFNKDLEGKNLSSLADTQGKKFIQEFVQTSLEHDQGEFISYSWSEPGVPTALHKEKGKKKIAFVRLFHPYNWVIGVSLYQDDIEEKIQQEIIGRLGAFRGGKTGYIFNHTFDGICLNHIKKDLIGKNRWELTDTNGRKLIQELDQKGRQPEGGFLEYVATINPVTGKPSKKISYIQSIDEWQWVLGTGVYLDEIDAKILALGSIHKKRMLDRLSLFLIVIVLAFIASYWVSTFLAKGLKHELLVFMNFFSQASKKHIKIDQQELFVTEFQQLAVDANTMLEEQQKNHRAISLAKSEWERTFDAVPDMIFILNDKMEIIRLNTAMAENLAMPMEEILHQPCYSIMHGSDSPPNRCQYSKILQNYEVQSYDFFEEKLGKHLQSTIAPLFDEKKRFLGSVHILRDITDQKKAEQNEKELQTRMQQMQKMQAIGTLAGGIAHDFNNILTGLLGYNEIAKMKLASDDPVQHTLDQILISGKRATELVRQILTFSHQADEELKPVKIQFAIKEALKLLRSTLPTTIQLKEHIDVSCAAVMADTTKMHQVVMNLCTNAKHAMGNEKGQLEITLSHISLPPDQLSDKPQIQAGQFVVLMVKDTGKGMDEATVARVFEPYFTTKKKGEGTGLGLAVTHGIVEECNGFIELESGPGKGTAFHIYLPAIKEEISEITDAEDNTPLPSGNESILCIDDEPTIIEVWQTILTSLGYNVSAETNSLNALAKFQAAPESFDLVITDQTMPDLTGAELAQAMLKLKPNLPIILCTGYTSAISKQEAYAIGIKRFATKPLSARELAETVRGMLDENSTL